MFADQLGWDVSVSGSRERDRYDDLHPAYLLWCDDTGTRLYGSIRLMPTTGRTHQLRVHAASGIGLPIVGDPVYGPSSGSAGGMHMMLHAATNESATDPHGALRDRLESQAAAYERFF